MWKSRYTDDQITDAIRRAASGEAITEICREMGVSRQAFYQWRSKCKGTGMMQRRLKQMEEENEKLKRLVADLSLDNHALQEELSKAVIPANGTSTSHILGDQPETKYKQTALV